MKASRCGILFLLAGLLTVPHSPLLGWGYKAHQFINRQAVKLLSGSLGEYYSHHINYISEHAIDPDLWRQEGDDPEEGHGHYIDADLYDDFPFTGIPRDRTVAEAMYGSEKLLSWGTAPWRIAYYVELLTHQFKSGQWDKIPLTTAALGHYVADIHMPLHVVENYNGQLTGNTGVHKRWEVDMIERYILSTVQPQGYPVYIADPVEMAFTIVIESYPLHFKLLQADSLARADLGEKQQMLINDREATLEGTSYIEILYNETGSIARQRMEDAALRVASYWLTAWQAAGSPPLPLQFEGQ